MFRMQLPFALPRWCTFCVRFVGAVVALWGGAFAAFLAVPGKLGPNTHIGGAKRANWAPTIDLRRKGPSHRRWSSVEREYNRILGGRM